MKKILATVLAVVMVATLCCVLFVSAEDTNLAAGKSYTTTAIYEVDGVQSWPDEGGVTLTDGVKAASDASYDDPCWVGFNKQSADYDASEGGFGAVTLIDLGAKADLTKVAFQAYGGAAGISVPFEVNLYTSVDGEEYTLAGNLAINGEDAVAGVNAYELAIDETAQYVKVCYYAYGWCFIDEIEVYGTEAAAEDPSDEPSDEPAGETKTYENTLTISTKTNDDGTEEKVASVEVPYGYTWTINYVDGTIVGEDATICTTQAAYEASNPNWAITIYAEKQEDGTYVALQDAIVTPGTAAAAGITVGENQIAIVVHSASSNPDLEAQYANWMGKIVACAVKAGDVFQVNEDMTSVYAVIPGESNDAPSEAPSETPSEDKKPQTGDAGILVFAVLGVVAICGAAVAIKARG